MRKRFLVTVATLATVTMLAACGGSQTNGGADTATPTTAATPTPTQAPEADHAAMVQNIYQAVVEKYGEAYYPEQQVQNESYYMEDTLKLDASWYDEAIVEVPMMTSNVDMFVVIHPTEGNLDNVKKALEDYQSYLINDSFQYPMNLPKVQGSVLEVVGEEYVIFSILSGLAEIDYDAIDMDATDEELEAFEMEGYKASSSLAVEVAKGVVSGEITVTPWTELDKVRNIVVKTYGSVYYPTEKVHENEEFLSMYLNDTLKLDTEWIDDIIIEIPAISTSVDTLILVDPSEGNAENVLNALKAYKDYLVNESAQYPMNVTRVQSAVVEQVGDYVCFVILGSVVEDPEAYGFTSDDEVAEYYTSMNMNAVYAIQSYLGIWE